MYELKIITFPVGHRGPLEDSSRAGCGPRAGRCAPLIYSYFWPNYSISLQKSPLSNILPVHMTRYNNILRPVHDPLTTPHDPLPKIWGSRPPNPPGLTPMSRGLTTVFPTINNYG